MFNRVSLPVGSWEGNSKASVSMQTLVSWRKAMRGVFTESQMQGQGWPSSQPVSSYLKVFIHRLSLLSCDLALVSLLLSDCPISHSGDGLFTLGHRINRSVSFAFIWVSKLTVASSL